MESLFYFYEKSKIFDKLLGEYIEFSNKYLNLKITSRDCVQNFSKFSKELAEVMELILNNSSLIENIPENLTKKELVAYIQDVKLKKKQEEEKISIFIHNYDNTMKNFFNFVINLSKLKTNFKSINDLDILTTNYNKARDRIYGKVENTKQKDTKTILIEGLKKYASSEIMLCPSPNKHYFITEDGTLKEVFLHDYVHKIYQSNDINISDWSKDHVLIDENNKHAMHFQETTNSVSIQTYGNKEFIINILPSNRITTKQFNTIQDMCNNYSKIIISIHKIKQESKNQIGYKYINETIDFNNESFEIIKEEIKKHTY